LFWPGQQQPHQSGSSNLVTIKLDKLCEQYNVKRLVRPQLFIQFSNCVSPEAPNDTLNERKTKVNIKGLLQSETCCQRRVWVPEHVCQSQYTCFCFLWNARQRTQFSANLPLELHRNVKDNWILAHITSDFCNLSLCSLPKFSVELSVVIPQR
jgi:hypothetical protein